MEYKLLYALRSGKNIKLIYLYKEYARYADTQYILSDAASS